MLLLSPKFILAAVILMLFSAPSAQQRYEFVVTGRAVDSFGKPVAHAWVVISPANSPVASGEVIVDDVVASCKSDATGSFRFEQTASQSSSQRILYIMAPLPVGAYAPLTPPYGGTSEPVPSLRGREILIRKNQEVDLGEVAIQIRYEQFFLDLQDEKGLPLDGTQNIWLRVRNLRGDVVSEATIPSSAYREDEKAISIALPEGKWDLEVAKAENRKIWNSINSLLVVMSDSQLRVSLKLTSHENPLLTTCFTHTSPNEARLELRRLGIPFNQDSFVERIENNNLSAVKLFLASGMDPNVKDKRDKTALIAAVGRNHIELAGLLLAAGADVNLGNSRGFTALMSTAISSDIALMKLLLANGANVNAQDEVGMTALMFATEENEDIGVLKTLLEANADATLRNRANKTALMLAEQIGNADFVSLLKAAR